MATLPKFLKTDYFLTAAECNAESELALSTLVRHIIESATEHANRLNVRVFASGGDRHSVGVEPSGFGR